MPHSPPSFDRLPITSIYSHEPFVCSPKWISSCLAHWGVAEGLSKLTIRSVTSSTTTKKVERSCTYALLLSGTLPTNIVFVAQVTFQLTGPREPRATPEACVCATDPNCTSAVAIYDVDQAWTHAPVFVQRYTVPGLVVACSPTDSLLSSTLECYFDNTDCLRILMNYTKQTYISNVEQSAWFDVSPLVYNGSNSRFAPQTLVSTMVKEMMIERWNESLDYDHFYESCAASYCVYTKTVRATPIEVITTLVSLIGGLTLLLPIVIPRIVQLTCSLTEKIIKKRAQQQQRPRPTTTTPVRRACLRRNFQRLAAMLSKVFTLLRTELSNFNIFLLRDFNSNLDRPIAKRLGRWATRLYFVLFVVALSVLAVHNLMQPRLLTKTFAHPPFELYQYLLKRHGDALKCPCSSIALTYKNFVQMEPVLHQVSRNHRLC